MLDKLQRYQTGLIVSDLFPTRSDGKCACGCNEELTGRRKRWASQQCAEKALTIFWVVKGDASKIRKLVFQRDLGICNKCGASNAEWEADHIVPVHAGGGGCGIENFQTLCKACHKQKTRTQTRSHQRANSSHEAAILARRVLNDCGAQLMACSNTS